MGGAGGLSRVNIFIPLNCKFFISVNRKESLSLTEEKRILKTHLLVKGEFYPLTNVNSHQRRRGVSRDCDSGTRSVVNSRWGRSK